jgi:hypothetical protein
MTKENGKTSAEQAEQAEQATKSGVRVAQVIATALAAVTAALLGSTLGVAGTVVGAGLASVVTTVGSEVYLRSLQRTREAAQRAKAAARSMTMPGNRQARSTQNLADQPTVRLPKPDMGRTETETGLTSKLRHLRWPLIIGTSVVGFVIAILAITGFESVTGKSLGGGNGTTVGRLVGNDSRTSPSETKQPAPSTGTSAPSKTTGAPTSSPAATPTPTQTPTPTATSPTGTTTAPPQTTDNPSPSPSSPQSPGTPTSVQSAAPTGPNTVQSAAPTGANTS